MLDITCPYCEKDFDLCHDDGAYYDENNPEQWECPDCNKISMVSSSVSWYHEAEKADCLNDGEHQWEQIHGAPEEYFIGMFRCSTCGEEESREPERRKKAIETEYHLRNSKIGL